MVFSGVATSLSQWVHRVRKTLYHGVSEVAKEAENDDPPGTVSLQSPPGAGAGPAIGTQTELIAVCGYPGVGKSTVSERLTGHLDAKRLRTDAIRKELFDEPCYSSEESRTVYRTAFDRARDALESNRTVVVDASFANRRHRDLAKQVALDCDVPFRLLKVECEESEVVRRIEHREDISDADVEVYYKIREEFDPIEQDHYRIDNSETLEGTLRQLDSLLGSSLQ